MRFCTIISAFVLLIALSACNSPERYAKNRKAGEQWLAAYTQPAKINLTGGWHSADWGTADFVQGNNRINGQIDEYTVYGRVSGTKAYLLISEGNWIYYTAVVSMPNKNAITGYYSKSVPFNPAKQKPIQFLAK